MLPEQGGRWWFLGKQPLCPVQVFSDFGFIKSQEGDDFSKGHQTGRWSFEATKPSPEITVAAARRAELLQTGPCELQAPVNTRHPPRRPSGPGGQAVAWE